MSLSRNWPGCRSHAWWIASAQQGLESKNRAPIEDNNISPTEDKQLKLARSCSEPCESKQGPNCAQTAQALAKSCESKHLQKKTWNPSHHSVQTSWVDRFFWAKTPLWDFRSWAKPLMALCNSIISILFWLPKKTQSNWCSRSFRRCFDAYNPDKICNRKLACLLIWTMTDSL